MTSVLERIEICFSFPVGFSTCGFLHVPEYIPGLWSLKQVSIKLNEWQVSL